MWILCTVIDDIAVTRADALNRSFTILRNLCSNVVKLVQQTITFSQLIALNEVFKLC